MLYSKHTLSSEQNILSEYPRPQMVRNQFRILNGYWDYAIGSYPEEPAAYDGKILVPFSPEAPLSGVNRQLKPGEDLWYHTEFQAAHAAGSRLLLHFGAVDRHADVFVNGAPVGSHEGGYLPFTFDITDFCTEERCVLTLHVTDPSDTAEQLRGKQRLKRGGIWYTAQSGIWQTVWTETVPENYIESLKITPIYDDAVVEITVLSSCNSICYIDFDGMVYGGKTNKVFRISIQNMHSWSPDDPHLYSFTARLGSDSVQSYFAMRKFSTVIDGCGIPRMQLNNRTIFQSGVLDQGYWPDGLYTAPSDEAIIHDIQSMKQMGFNMLRKHIKIEPLRYYYHCDRLGMIVWQDMINGGGAYSPAVISLPLITERHMSDTNLRRFSRNDPAEAEAFEAQLLEMIRHLYNAPCIALWTIFNEGWGQFRAAYFTDLVKKADATRWVDHASGWHDQGVSDVKSWHVYFKPFRFRKDKANRAVVLSEFGGYTYYVSDHSYNEKAFGYKHIKDPEQLLSSVRRLYLTEILPVIRSGLCACVYTQLSDVEDECNGMLTYDRQIEKLPPSDMKKINFRLYQEADIL